MLNYFDTFLSKISKFFLNIGSFIAYPIAVRLRSNKKVQNLSKMCYKFFRQPLVAQGDFGHEFS